MGTGERFSSCWFFLFLWAQARPSSNTGTKKVHATIIPRCTLIGELEKIRMGKEMGCLPTKYCQKDEALETWLTS